MTDAQHLDEEEQIVLYNKPLDETTVLSYQRTALSYERTLMAWIRTATSMISFGFTIYKFFEDIQEKRGQQGFLSPRLIAMMMIAYGFIGLLFAQVQHRIAYKKLNKSYPQVQRSLSSVLGYLMLAFGLLLFLAALLRQ